MWIIGGLGFVLFAIVSAWAGFIHNAVSTNHVELTRREGRMATLESQILDVLRRLERIEVKLNGLLKTT